MKTNPEISEYDRFKYDMLASMPMNSGIREALLQRKDYAARIAINEEQLDRLRRHSEIRQWRDELEQQLVLSLHASIYGKDHPQRHVIRYPENWWEAVKERFAPCWFRDMYPVRFTEITASLDELYPEVQPALPDKRPVMKFYTTNRIDTPIW